MLWFSESVNLLKIMATVWSRFLNEIGKDFHQRRITGITIEHWAEIMDKIYRMMCFIIFDTDGIVYWIYYLYGIT